VPTSEHFVVAAIVAALFVAIIAPFVHFDSDRGIVVFRRREHRPVARRAILGRSALGRRFPSFFDATPFQVRVNGATSEGWPMTFSIRVLIVILDEGLFDQRRAQFNALTRSVAKAARARIATFSASEMHDALDAAREICEESLTRATRNLGVEAVDVTVELDYDELTV
jgi:hypothetical protein